MIGLMCTWESSTARTRKKLQNTSHGMIPTSHSTGLPSFTILFMIDLNLTVEDHGGDFPIPVGDPDFLARFPDLSVPELVRLVALGARTEALMAEGKLAVLARDRWPLVCEARVRRDIQAVKRMLGGSGE